MKPSSQTTDPKGQKAPSARTKHRLLGFESKPAGQDKAFTMRWVTCSCGWNQMIHGDWNSSYPVDKNLKKLWESHAYTKEERSLLKELGGDYYAWP